MTNDLQNAFDQVPAEQEDYKKDPYPYLKCGFDYERKELENVLATLRQSKTGRQLLEDAERHQTIITFDNGMRAYGSYNEFDNVVKLNSSSSMARLVGTAAHELRHAQQFQNGIELDALTNMPQSYIKNQAIIEADASVTSAHVCYELALQGNVKPLESLREKDSHIVNAFQNEAVQGGLDDGRAHRAGFKAWFTDYSIRDSYESLYCRMVTQRKKEADRAEKETAFTREVPQYDVVKKSCLLGGKPYLSEKETKEFFNSPDLNTVSYERYCQIYRDLNDTRRFPELGWEIDNVEKVTGLKQRPHSSYMPRRKEVEALPLPAAGQEKKAGAIKPAVMNALLAKRVR